MPTIEAHQAKMRIFLAKIDDIIAPAAFSCTRLLGHAILAAAGDNFPRILWTSGKGELPKPVDESIRRWEHEEIESFGSGTLYAVESAPGLIVGQEAGPCFRSIIVLTPDGMIGRYGQAPGVEPGKQLTLRYPKIDEGETSDELTLTYAKKAIQALTRREVVDIHANGNPRRRLELWEHQCHQCRYIADTQQFYYRDKCPNCLVNDWQ